MNRKSRLLSGTTLAAFAVAALAAALSPGHAAASGDDPYARPGFFTQLDKDGRLWVFKAGSPELAEFQAKGVPARHVVRPGAGPNGVTLKAVESHIILEYVAARPGFFTQLDKNERLWVFKVGSPELAEFQATGAPARHVVRPGVGPLGMTLKAVESDIIVEYVTARPGYFTQLDKDGRLWVFKAGSPELAEFQAKGAPARHVVRPGAGPLGLTLKATDAEVLDAYLAAS